MYRLCRDWGFYGLQETLFPLTWGASIFFLAAIQIAVLTYGNIYLIPVFFNYIILIFFSFLIQSIKQNNKMCILV